MTGKLTVMDFVALSDLFIMFRRVFRDLEKGTKIKKKTEAKCKREDFPRGLKQLI